MATTSSSAGYPWDSLSCAVQQYYSALSRWSRASQPAGEPDYSRERILIADDDVSIIQPLEIFLNKRLGCSVAAVQSGDDALPYLEAHAVDVLIVDMMMPGLHGLDLVKAVSRVSPYTDIIVMTGYSTDFPYVDVVKAGAKDIIAKPFRHPELEAKLVRIFNERDLRDAQLLAETKYRSIFELNTDGMVLVDGKRHAIIDVNRAFCEMSGVEAEALHERIVFDLLAPEERERFQHGLTFCGRTGQGTLGDVALVRSDGKHLMLDVSVTFISVSGEEIACLAFKDVTEKRALEGQLVDTAQQDALTGLLNQRAFHLHLDGAVARAHKTGTPLALMSIDLDAFKECNDTHGHPTGDQLLRTIGRLIRKSIRSGNDEGFRCGGDEFAVVLSGAATEVAMRIAERMRDELAHGENYGTTMSIGIAKYEPPMNATALVRAADTALYRAKSQGKNQTCIG